MGDSRQITVLRSLFATLHPKLKSSLENGLAPARQLLTGAQPNVEPEVESAAEPRAGAAKMTDRHTAANNETPLSGRLPRSLTDEHLINELENVSRQHDVPDAPRKPKRGRTHYSRDTLLLLLEEAKVRIQVLETELELARGTEESIPLLTEEWADNFSSPDFPRTD